MAPFFIILSGISLLALISGFVWVSARSGKAMHRSGEQVEMGDSTDQTPENNQLDLAQYAEFNRKAREIRLQEGLSFTEFKKLLVNREWREVMPYLLVLGGIFGVFIFGSLAIFINLENKMVGGIVIAVATYAVLRTAFNIARA